MFNFIGTRMGFDNIAYTNHTIKPALQGNEQIHTMMKSLRCLIRFFSFLPFTLPLFGWLDGIGSPGLHITQKCGPVRPIEAASTMSTELKLKLRRGISRERHESAQQRRTIPTMLIRNSRADRRIMTAKKRGMGRDRRTFGAQAGPLPPGLEPRTPLREPGLREPLEEAGPHFRRPCDGGGGERTRPDRIQEPKRTERERRRSRGAAEERRRRRGERREGSPEGSEERHGGNVLEGRCAGPRVLAEGRRRAARPLFLRREPTGEEELKASPRIT